MRGSDAIRACFLGGPSNSRTGQLRQRLAQDEGTSLIELMVGMMLMAIFMSMFTGAIVSMNVAMNKSQGVNLSSSQLNVAFANLDNTVRYASAIGTPGFGPGTGPGGAWYEEFRSLYTGTETQYFGTDVCTQVRVDFDSEQLQRRTWASGVVPTPTPAFVPLASGITNGSETFSGPTTQPFYLVPLPPNALFQQLTVNLIAPAGPASSVTTSTASFTFTAMNSSLPVPTQICQEVSRS